MAAKGRLRLKLKYSNRRLSSDSSPAGDRVSSDTMEAGSKVTMQSSPINTLPPVSSPLTIDTTNTLPSRINMPLAPAPTTNTTARRRRHSKAVTGHSIKRSASTSNVRRRSTGDSSMSMADKRRSKLGYHRTSVACVHCRRRKIRCLLAPDDPQNRCANCIRLKKECNFFPVDQQPPVERRPRAGSKTGSRSRNTSQSSSASPGYGGPHVMDQVDQFGHYSMPMGMHDYSSSMVPPLATSMISPPASAAPIGSRVFDFSQQPERTGWDPQLMEHDHMSGNHSASDLHSANYWKAPGHAPMTPEFSPYTTGPQNSLSQHPSEAGGGYAQYGGPRQIPGWTLPTRAMSIGHPDDVPHQYQGHSPYQYHPYQQLDHRQRRGSDMRPPSLGSVRTSTNSSNTSMSDATPTAPMSAPLTSQPHHFGAWQGVSGQSPSIKGPEYGNWYSLPNVQEEDPVPRYGTDPEILYSSAGHT